MGSVNFWSSKMSSSYDFHVMWSRWMINWNALIWQNWPWPANTTCVMVTRSPRHNGQWAWAPAWPLIWIRTTCRLIITPPPTLPYRIMGYLWGSPSPEPPYIGEKDMYSLSRVLVPIALEITKNAGLSRCFLGKSSQDYAPKFPLFRENGNTHMRPPYAFEWGGGGVGGGYNRPTFSFCQNLINVTSPQIKYLGIKYARCCIWKFAIRNFFSDWE